jgi:hypothetical protein
MKFPKKVNRWTDNVNKVDDNYQGPIKYNFLEQLIKEFYCHLNITTKPIILIKIYL